MIAQIASRGTSFNGASLYYLHDKKADTKERVEWTETRNLQTNNPDMAFRVMAATAMDKDRLKAQAGVSNTGRKSKGDVYAYSVAWHPDEQGKFNKDEMLDVADQSLKALGATNHQAVIVAHNDEPHPHIHIIVNMVNPDNGKNLNLSNDRKKLHKWSNDWRKERGEEHKYTPNKAKKFETIEAKKRGEKVEYFNKGKSKSRKLNDVFETAKANVTPTEAQNIKRQEAAKDKALSDYGRKLNSRQSNEWEALSKKYDDRKQSIPKEYFKQKDAARENIKEQMKPHFKALYKQQWLERTKFEAREKRITGKLRNVIDAVKHAKAVRGENNKGFLTMARNFATKKGRRELWLKSKHGNQLKALRGEENKLFKGEVSKLNKKRISQYAGARLNFSQERDSLISKQQGEKADLKNRWSVRHDERKQVIDTLKRKGKVSEKDSKLLTANDRAFAKALYRENLEKERAKGHTRSRTRKRTPD